MPRWTRPNARERLEQAIAVNPQITRLEAIRAAGISRQRMHQIMSEVDDPITKMLLELPEPSYRKWPAKLASLYPGMSPFVAACVAEMAVCFDLLKRNYDVYKSVTQGGGCDLVAIHRKSGKLMMVEVKSARREPSGRITYTVSRHNKFDVLALVLRDEDVLYKPELE